MNVHPSSALLGLALMFGGQDARAQAQARPPAAPPAQRAVLQYVDSAITTADVWLSMIDGGQVSESWRAGAPILQQASSQQSWAAYLAKARATHGRPLARQWVNVRRAVNPEGMPPGEYLTLQYATRFEKVIGGVEQVSLTIQQGRWVPAGYNVIK